MNFHFMGDRTERAFSRGQRSMTRWSFDEAIRSFDVAIDSDPGYPHLYMYKGLALAELGRYEDAIAALGQAMRIQPANFVFPMCLGCIHFDEGHADAAAEAFEKAAALAPANPLVSSYKLLTDYVKGDKQVLERLASNLSQMPDGFNARLLLTSSDWTDYIPPKTHDAVPDSKRPIRFGAVGEWLQRLRMRRLTRRAQRLLDRKKYDVLLDLLRGRELPDPLQALAERARVAALKDLDDKINRMPPGKGKSDSQPELKRRLAHETQRRSLLLSRATLRADDRSRVRDLEHWIKSYRQSGSPKRSSAVAAEILVEMADVERRQGRLDVAIGLCEQGRAEGASADVDWIEAQIRALSGPHRHARRLLERFAVSRFISFNQRVKDQVGKRLAAGMATRA